MKSKRIILGVILMSFFSLSIFGSNTNEEKFWKWFEKNEVRIFEFEKDKNKIFNELSSQLTKINKDLTFEFGPVEKGKRDFVISAGGIIESFSAVEKLFLASPKMKRWNIIKFRPRRNPINDLNFGGKNIKADDVYYMLFKDDDLNKVGIAIFLDGYKEKERDIYAQMGYLFLDEAIGEYDVETKVGAIVFESKESKYFKQAKRLKEIGKEFDEYFNSNEN